MENLVPILAKKAIEAQKYEEILDKPHTIDDRFLSDPDNVRIEMFSVMKDAFGPFLKMPEEDTDKIISRILDNEEIFSRDSIAKLSHHQRDKMLYELCHLTISRSDFSLRTLITILNDVFREEIAGDGVFPETFDN